MAADGSSFNKITPPPTRNEKKSLFSFGKRSEAPQTNDTQFIVTLRSVLKERNGKPPTDEEVAAVAGTVDLDTQKSLGTKTITKETVAKYDAIIDRAFIGAATEQTPLEARQSLADNVFALEQRKGKESGAQDLPYEEADIITAFETVREHVGSLDAKIANAERELREKQSHLHRLKAERRASSGDLKESQTTEAQLEEIGDFSGYLAEVDATAKDKLTPEEHLAFCSLFLENLAAGKQEKIQKRSNKYKIFAQAIRVARKRVRDGSVDIPALVGTMEKKDIGTTIKNTLSRVAGTGSGVLDAGTASSLIMYGLMSTYGASAAKLFAFGSFGHIGLFAGCVVALAPVAEKIEQEAWVKPALQDPAYLNDKYKREHKRTNLKRVAKRTASQIASLLITGLQAHSVLWTVAATNQGSDTSVAIQEGIEDQRAQIRALDIEDFDERTQASFDDVALASLEENDAFAQLSVVEQEAVRIRLTRRASVRTEAGGEFIEGVGGGTQVGYEFRASAKDVLGSGENEQAPTDTLSPAAERGREVALEARRRIAERFHERFPNHPGVFLDTAEDPVSIEEQLLILHNDYKVAMQPHLVELEQHFNDITELGNEIRRWTGGEIIETNAEDGTVIPTEEPTALEDALHRIFGSWTVKGAFSIGKKAPSESTITPEFEELAAPDSPVFAIQHAFNEKFSEPATYFLELVAQEMNTLDATGGRAGSIRIDVPQAELDPTTLTGTPLQGEPNFFGSDFYDEAFSDPLRSTGAGLLMILILFLRYGKSSIQLLSYRKNKDQIQNAFWERRKSFEGEGDTREGAEYRFAEYVANNLNLLLSHESLRGAFAGIRFDPELVLSAMREAAAKERESAAHASPLKTHSGILGTLANLGAEHLEAFAEIPQGAQPLPPAVEAFNHLVRLYRDPARLSVRLMDELMPGFDEVLTAALSKEDSRALRNLALDRGLPEDVALKYARIQASFDTVKIGHLQFRIRHEQSRIEFMRGEAFNEIYHQVTGDDIKDLKFFNEQIDVRHADFASLRAQYGKSLEMLRHSAISRIITAEMQSAFTRATASIESAQDEILEIKKRESLTSANYGGAVAKVMADAARERTTRFSDQAFAAPADLQVTQFSSSEALERQYVETIVRRFEKKWGGEFEKDEEGTDLVEQLDAMQHVVNNTSFFGDYEVPVGYGQPTITIDPRVRGKKKGEVSSVSDQETEQFTDYHVVRFDFFDNTQNKIFSQEAEIRGTLSDQNSAEFVENQIRAWIVNRQVYFALRVSQWELQKRLSEAMAENDKAIQSYRLGGARLSLPAFGRTRETSDADYKPVNLFSKNAEESIGSLLKGLKPFLLRRDRLSQLERANEQARKDVDANVHPAYSQALKRKSKRKGGEDPRTQLELTTKSRHKSTRKRVAELENELKTSVITERFDEKEFERVRSLLTMVRSKQKELRSEGIQLLYNVRSNSVTIRHKGLVGKASIQTVSTGDLMAQLANTRNLAATMKAIAKRQTERVRPSRNSSTNKRKAA